MVMMMVGSELDDLISFQPQIMEQTDGDDDGWKWIRWPNLISTTNNWIKLMVMMMVGSELDDLISFQPQIMEQTDGDDDGWKWIRWPNLISTTNHGTGAIHHPEFVHWRLVTLCTRELLGDKKSSLTTSWSRHIMFCPLPE